MKFYEYLKHAVCFFEILLPTFLSNPKKTEPIVIISHFSVPYSRLVYFLPPHQLEFRNEDVAQFSSFIKFYVPNYNEPLSY